MTVEEKHYGACNEILFGLGRGPSGDFYQGLLEARALAALGKADEAAKRWRRHLESAKGGTRQWI